MNIVIIGAGRMGQRHGMGIASVKEIGKIAFVDVKEEALYATKQQFSSQENKDKVKFFLPDQFERSPEKYDIAILAATAGKRLDSIQWMQKRGIQQFLIEKPLGQSLSEVKALENHILQHSLDASVNLSMRLQDHVLKLRDDLSVKPQLQGPKTLMINTGSMGIGANGIHYLDLAFFLLNADSARLTAGEIDETIIPSPRGSEFHDFGGWCKIDYFKDREFMGKAIFSFSSQCTVFGGLDIVAPHGRILLDEFGQKRTDVLRKEDSQMPIYRYAADYLPPQEDKYPPVFLGDLTRKWLLGLMEEKKLLPSVSEALKSHELMFDWLSKSKRHTETFPIT